MGFTDLASVPGEMRRGTNPMYLGDAPRNEPNVPGQRRRGTNPMYLGRGAAERTRCTWAKAPRNEPNVPGERWRGTNPMYLARGVAERSYLKRGGKQDTETLLLRR